MNPDFPFAVFQFADGQGIVKNPGIQRIDGESENVTEIISALPVFGRYRIRAEFCFLDHFVGEISAEPEFRQNTLVVGQRIVARPKHPENLAHGQAGRGIPTNELD